MLTAVLDRGTAMLSSLRRAWIRATTHGRVRNELLTYTDRELFDLRIGPSDIDD